MDASDDFSARGVRLSDRTAAPEGTSLKGFLVLSRLPFLLPGVAALATGIAIGALTSGVAAFGLVSISMLGIVLIMLATYYFNEYFDYEGDLMNKTFTKFSGGSRAIPDLKVPRKVARIAGWSSVAMLVVTAAAYLLAYFEDFPWLLPMALLGSFFGIFYSHPPFQWAYRGVGEAMIGFCYGILAVVSGFYLTTGDLEPTMVLIGMPAALTIFGVIVVNEFPDIEADRAVGKRNLVVRMGLDRGGVLFSVAMLLAYPAMLLTIVAGVDFVVAIAGLPVLFLCLAVAIDTLKGRHKDPKSQTTMAGITLLANLLSSLMFILVYLAPTMAA
jgi:1,4-dihydroxy-2-naphthoate octaprenyltransferase